MTGRWDEKVFSLTMILPKWSTFFLGSSCSVLLQLVQFRINFQFLTSNAEVHFSSLKKTLERIFCSVCCFLRIGFKSGKPRSPTIISKLRLYHLPFFSPLYSLKQRSFFVLQQMVGSFGLSSRRFTAFGHTSRFFLCFSVTFVRTQVVSQKKKDLFYWI